jgi:hypothetical protein
MNLNAKIIMAMAGAGITAHQISEVAKTLKLSNKVVRKARNDRYRAKKAIEAKKNILIEAEKTVLKVSIERQGNLLETKKTVSKDETKISSKKVSPSLPFPPIDNITLTPLPLPSSSKPITSLCSVIGADAGAREEEKPRQKRKTSISETEQPVEADLDFARKAGMESRQIREEWQQFRDHHRMKGNLMLDWRAAWRTWVRNAIRYVARGSPGGPRSNGMGELSRWVYEGIDDDRRKREEKSAEIVPLLQLGRGSG